MTCSAEVIMYIVTSYDCLFSVVSCPLSCGYCKLQSLLQIFTVQPLKTVHMFGSIALCMQLSWTTYNGMTLHVFATGVTQIMGLSGFIHHVG
jgi:hypothetical protein